MAGTPEEVARQFEEQTRVQMEQLGIIRAQQESIDALKQMLSQLIKEKKMNGRTPSKKSKCKLKEWESSSSANVENEEHSNSEPPISSSEKEDNSKNKSSHSKRISKLEQRLEALTNRDGLQDVGIVGPYLAEWDTAPYPPKFKAPTLHTFDGKGPRTNTYTT